MKFFSGFSLQNEEVFFTDFIDSSDFNVCGFSYGAIKAFNYTLESIKSGKRVDRIQLFSPVFFEDKDEKFKRLQLLGYKQNKDAYVEQFLKNCFLPYSRDCVSLYDSSEDELRELLYYRWDKDKLSFLVKKGVALEIYLGGADKIINANRAKEFFLPYATITYIKEANHFLQKGTIC